MRKHFRPIVLAIAITASAPLAAQQDNMLVAKVRPLGRPQTTVSLQNLPREMIRLDTEGGWQTITPVEGGFPGVRRAALPMQRCLQPSDSIDLRRLRMSGYAVVEYRLITDAAPSGYKISAHAVVRAYKRDGTRLINARNPAEIDVINVSPTIHVLDIPVRGRVQRMGCAAGWRLEIKAVGPQGTDPLSGWAK